MKQIFDWMRKKPLKAFEVYDGSIGVYPCEVNRLIDEAEAKWEADCCEWKNSQVYGYIRNPHTGKIYINEPSMQNVYCNTCGKKIKISEVE